MKNEITVIAVDDDAMSAKRLCNDLSFFPDIRVIGSYVPPKKAMKLIVREQPDALFLDIKIPGISGIELLKRIQLELHSDHLLKRLVHLFRTLRRRREPQGIVIIQ